MNCVLVAQPNSYKVAKKYCPECLARIDSNVEDCPECGYD